MPDAFGQAFGLQQEMEKTQQVTALAFGIGFAVGLVVTLEIIDRLVVKRLWKLVDYWRNEQVKAKREAIAAKLQIIQERQDDINRADWWRKED